MKRFCLSVFAVASMLLAASCQQELNPVTDGDTTVTFTVNAGDVATRAIADGTNIDVLHWEIYKTADVATATQPLGKDNIVDKDGNKEFTVELKLLADQEYTIIFWAEVENAGHYDTADLRNVAIEDYDDENANDESRAAFFRVYPFETENGETITETIELYRPFSQINLGSTTYETSFNKVNDGNVKVNTSEMTVTKIATSFNTLSGQGEGEQIVTFKAQPTPNAPADDTQKILKVNDLYYYWIGMNYLIVCGDADNVDVDITLDTNFGEVKHTVSSVPVKENFRTNLLGNFLTTDATFTVVVDEAFQKPDEIVPVPGEDGNGSSSTYTVATVADLVWLQQQVNNGNTFSGKTVKLTSDLDLGGMEWTPIDGFKGTFDGSKGTKAADDNYTISNFTVNVNKCGGLFGSVNGKILNVNVENATVTSNHYAGALVGYAYGRIENCHAENVTVTTEPELINGKYDNGDKAGAIVGYICGEPMSYLVNCSATNATVTAYRDLGAVAGCIAGKMTVEGNTAKDCKIVVDQIIDGEYAGSNTANANPVVGRNQTKNITAEEFEAINNAAEDVDNTATTTPDEATTLAELVAVEGAVVEVPAGEYTFPASVAAGVTINCAEGTVFTGTSSLNIKGATVIGATFENDGIAVCGIVDGTFKNCTFDGSEALRWCYIDEGDEILFEDCVIKTDFRGVHFDDMKGNVTFRRCEINGFNAYGGKGTATFENCVFGNDESSYNGLNTYSNTVLKDCKFVYNSGKTNFIDMEGTGKTLSITNCTATLDGTETPVIDFVGGSQLANNTVILDGKTYASSQTSLLNALNNGATDVLLKDGNYTMPEPDLKGKGLTITGSKDVVIDASAVDARDQFVTGATLKFEGVTLNFGKVNYMGFANTASLTYKDCKINGLQFLFGENVVFENCDLDSNGAEHTVWTYGVKNVSFTDCDFTYGDRGVNCYSDNDVPGGQTVNFTKCTFATENTASEGAVEINSCFISGGIVVNMEGCTAPAYGEMAYVSPWDSTNGANTTINIK